MLKKLNRSAKVSILLYAAIFAYLLLCNMLTAKQVDDFMYLYSFAQPDQRITSVGQIFPSLYAHLFTMNGRMVAHFFAQLFLMLPDMVFDVVNAAVFTLQIALVYQLTRGKQERNNLILLSVFAAVWLYEPAFGQVNLWLDGACNYLWAITFCLVFIKPFVEFYLLDKRVSGIAGTAGFLLISLLAGAFSENTSLGFIGIAMLLTALNLFWQKKKGNGIYIASIAVSCVGYVSMYLAPAQWRAKAAAVGLGTLLRNLSVSFDMFNLIGVLMAAFLVLLILNISLKADKKQILLAAAFFAGCLASHFIMLAASYHAHRSVAGTMIMLLLADGVLIYNVWNSKQYQILTVCALAVMLLGLPGKMLSGFVDVYSTFAATKQNEAYICEQRDAGVMDISVPVVVGRGQYSAMFDLKYLDEEDVTTWPNYHMARYYGVNSLIGVSEE